MYFINKQQTLISLLLFLSYPLSLSLSLLGSEEIYSKMILTANGGTVLHTADWGFGGLFPAQERGQYIFGLLKWKAQIHLPCQQ